MTFASFKYERENSIVRDARKVSEIDCRQLERQPDADDTSSREFRLSFSRGKSRPPRYLTLPVFAALALPLSFSFFPAGTKTVIASSKKRPSDKSRRAVSRVDDQSRSSDVVLFVEHFGALEKCNTTSIVNNRCPRGLENTSRYVW